MAAAAFVLIANTVPVYGVLNWGWSVANLFVLYWAETIVATLVALGLSAGLGL